MVENGNFPERRLARLKRDRGFVMELVHGSLRQQAVMVWLEQRWVKRTPSVLTRGIIHVGFYQLLFWMKLKFMQRSMSALRRPSVSRMDWVQQSW